MCELILNSKSDNTIKSYFYAFTRWEQFISLHGHCAIPAQPVQVAFYLTSLLNNAVYGIKWAHEINGLPDPTTNTFVSSVLEASKRIAVKLTEKKEPISPDTLIELCNMFKDSVDLLIVIDLAMILFFFQDFSDTMKLVLCVSTMLKFMTII